ncbi:MAG TPA: amidohydrolase family protein [Candidatus Eisenbacteria bacterium]|nr:amidohydrolase family protein [Candidatus Eisenbacteria bacterium]
MKITELGDADGHIIEPGDLWAERMPADLREMAPRFGRDEQGVFRQHIYGIDIATLDTMHGGMRPRDMLQNMGLAAAMGQDLARVFSDDDRERYTMVDAPEWTRDGKKRLAFNLEHGVGRAVLFPTFMLAGGTFQPHIAAAACQVYNDWIQDDYCKGSGGRLIPVAALPIVDVDASIAETKRVAERGFPAVFIRTNPVLKKKYSDRSFDPLWQTIQDAGVKLGLHPLPVWDQDGTARGFALKDIMAASALGFPLDMMHTLYDMMAGGVFDRFPQMQTMILEAGCGWIPSMFERFEEHMEMFGKVKAPEWKSKPMDIFLRQMMVTVEACEEIDIKIALQFLPADHIALASDWPHYDGTPDLLAGFAKATHGLADEDVRMLATGTLERWFPS